MNKARRSKTEGLAEGHLGRLPGVEPQSASAADSHLVVEPRSTRPNLVHLAPRPAVRS